LVRTERTGVPPEAEFTIPAFPTAVTNGAFKTGYDGPIVDVHTVDLSATGPLLAKSPFRE